MKSMHRFLLACGLALGVSATVAAAPTCTNPTIQPKANTELVKKFYEAFNTKNKALLDSVLATDWEDIPKAPGQGPGLAGMKDAMDGYYSSFPDFTATNEDFVATGNKVVVRSTIRATQEGEFSSVKPSGKKIEVMAIDIHELCGGKVVRTWHVEDWLSGLFQMSALPMKAE